MILIQIIFIIALLGIFQTYLFYPLFIQWAHKLFSKPNKKVEPLLGSPTIEIIFAAYNEESVITEKIISSFESDFLPSNISVRVGTDKCNDNTDALIRDQMKTYPNLFHHPFPQRTGKSGIINSLIEESGADILILTDANVIFNEETVRELIKPLRDPKVGAVGGNIIYQKKDNKGISQQEDSYLKLENRIKNAESSLFGYAMGLEGGCYSVRRELFPIIPPLFFMEDFYVSLSIIEKDYKLLFNSNATCSEDVSIDNTEEYKRKVRISIGNFQNLNRFKLLIFTKFTPFGFMFLSHKVLRWFTPFFLIALLLSSILLLQVHPLFLIFSGLYFAFLSAGLLGILFSQSKNASWLKYPGHFIHMNLALLKGFFIYLKGVETNVWQPTSRNQE